MKSTFSLFYFIYSLGEKCEIRGILTFFWQIPETVEEDL